jgi:hypothetical protein
MIGSAYEDVTSRRGRVPIRGSMTSGNSAVASRGTTALSHQTAIQLASPATRQAGSVMPKSGPVASVMVKRMGPIANGMGRIVSWESPQAVYLW